MTDTYGTPIAERRMNTARLAALVLGLTGVLVASPDAASGQGLGLFRRRGTPAAIPTGTSAMAPTSANDLLRLDGPRLDALYATGAPSPLPAGRVRGKVLMYPGTWKAPHASRLASLVWQGKVFRPADNTLTNRVFGLPALPAVVYPGASWLDGRPASIVDYEHTSFLYRNYRDEIREVAPGLYLGLMYARTSPDPTLKMYFALEAPRH